MAIFAQVENFRRMKSKIYIDDKEVYSGEIDDAPSEYRKLYYSKVIIDDILNLYIYTEEQPKNEENNEEN